MGFLSLSLSAGITLPCVIPGAFGPPGLPGSSGFPGMRAAIIITARCQVSSDFWRPIFRVSPGREYSSSPFLSSEVTDGAVQLPHDYTGWLHSWKPRARSYPAVQNGLGERSGNQLQTGPMTNSVTLRRLSLFRCEGQARTPWYPGTAWIHWHKGAAGGPRINGGSGNAR